MKTRPLSTPPRSSPIHQVDEILAQNVRILAMNEILLKAILRHHDVSGVVTVAPTAMDIDEIMRNKA